MFSRLYRVTTGLCIQEWISGLFLSFTPFLVCNVMQFEAALWMHGHIFALVTSVYLILSCSNTKATPFYVHLFVASKLNCTVICGRNDIVV